MRRKKTVRSVAILGTGYIAEWHMKALRSVKGVRVVAACDANRSRAAGFAERFGIASVYGSIDELAAHRPLDAVHVLLPPEHHVEAARVLVRSGVNVVLEKPMGVTCRACGSLVVEAEEAGVQVAVSHNFLFAEVYERLRRDVREGVLGRIDQVRIVWNKELAQVSAGPFDGWLFREPENVMLEIGPHSVAQMLDLAGPAEIVGVRASNPVELPDGRRFYRRWRVEAEAGDGAAGSATGIDLTFSFVPGFSEHAIEVRGSLASATADFERNTYVLHKHTRFGFDLDSSARVAREAAEVRVQARRNLRRLVLAKVTRSPHGNPFGASIARSLSTIYANLGSVPDPRISASFGRDVVALCERIGAMAGLPREEPRRVEVSWPSPRRPAEILVLGATGFIGRELVRQLSAAGRPVRVLARNPGGWASTFEPQLVETVPGDAACADDLARSLEGVTRVIHLARAHAKTWAEYRKDDVEVTRAIAGACLARGVERLIYSSSIAAYYTGRRAGTITEETPVVPSSSWHDPYARSKAANEELLLAMHREQGLPVVIVRPGLVLGRGGSPFHFGVGYWSRDAICQFYGDGTNPLPIVLVEDVATAIIAALDAPGVEGESFNLVGEASLTAREYLEELERCSRSRFEKFPTPIARFYLGDMGKWLVKVLVRHHDRRRPCYREWEARTQRGRFDCTRARVRLNWTPTDDRSEVIRRGIHEPMAERLR